jgi:DNA-binding NarL/FixJ family response regulator
VCVIDDAGDGDRTSAWLRAGSAAVVSENEPFDQLFQIITRLTRISPPHSVPRGPAASTADPLDARSQAPRLELFARLTEREQVVLSELMEGHCAEDIAKGAFVSISTVRSQIKAILHKLGVNSQLAAVAMARRAGWSLQLRPASPPKPSNGRRRQAS